MRVRGNYKPSKFSSALTVLFGISFTGFSVFVFLHIQGDMAYIMSPFILAGGGVTVYHLVNIFSSKGIAHEVVDFESSTINKQSPKERLEKIESLKLSGLINEQEYKEQRTRVLNDI